MFQQLSPTVFYDKKSLNCKNIISIKSKSGDIRGTFLGMKRNYVRMPLIHFLLSMIMIKKVPQKVFFSKFIDVDVSEQCQMEKLFMRTRTYEQKMTRRTNRDIS